jgi:hypothetical protein
MASKVAILGTVGNSRRVAPYDDHSWDIWSCSPGNSGAACPPRVTEWYELHSMIDMKSPENASWFGPYIAWLNQQSFPIYMQERNQEVPNALPFPRKPLVDKWGPSDVRTNWFTSSIAWMLAYAMHRGYTTIGIFGVDMAAAEEHYTMQKAGLLRFFEIAREAGLKIVVPLESTLSVGAPLYGYAESSRMGRAMIVREQELKDRLAQLENHRQSVIQEIAFFRGAQEQVTFDRRTWVSGLDDAEVDFEPEPLTVMSQKARDSLSKAAIEGSTRAMDDFMQHGSLLVPVNSPPRTAPPSASDFADPRASALLRAKSNGADPAPPVSFVGSSADKLPENTMEA